MTPEEHDDEPTRRTTLRLPTWLYDAVAERAEENRRSLNQEIAHCIMEQLSPCDLTLENKTRDQLLGFQAGFLLAVSSHPPEVEGVSREDVELVILTLVDHVRSRRGDTPDDS